MRIRLSLLTAPLVSVAVVACLNQQSAPPAAPAAESKPAARQVKTLPPPAIETMNGELPGFMRGINLGNGLDAPTEGAWGVRLGDKHFEVVKAAGLDHVRLPVRFSAHAGATAPFTIEPAFFARVDWAIEQAQKQKLSIIVDLHHYEELMKDPDANADRFVGLWAQIAERYKNQPASVAFELANEPCEKLTPEKLNVLHARALEVVRKTNPTRIVIVDSYFWAGADYLKQLQLPEDPNLVASFHMYQPILLTHQAAPWMPPEFGTPGVVFPGPPDKPIEPKGAAKSTGWVNDWFRGYNTQPFETNPGGPKSVYDYFQVVEKYVAASKRRVYLGEFGIMDTADEASREAWLGLVRKEAERRKIGWAYWDDGGKFKGMNVSQGTWVPVIQRALFD
jgi:endoglucanase